MNASELRIPFLSFPFSINGLDSAPLFIPLAFPFDELAMLAGASDASFEDLIKFSMLVLFYQFGGVLAICLLISFLGFEFLVILFVCDASLLGLFYN